MAVFILNTCAVSGCTGGDTSMAWDNVEYPLSTDNTCSDTISACQPGSHEHDHGHGHH